MKTKKKKIGTIILIIICFVGLCALLYPTVANYWNANLRSRDLNDYVAELANVSEEDYQKYWQEAIQFNEDMKAASYPFTLPGDLQERYEQCLNINGSGIMGYIEVPKIDVSLPLYHGTSNSVLSIAIGHLEWTSLPTGGEGTHCCVSGHRGLASAKLFTDLDRLREGDQFTLNILDEVLTYEVDQIRTVLPHELSDLAVDPDRDYCTMITCTPYGINTHRLLVRGHRVATVGPEVHVVSEAVLIDNLMVAMFLAIPILFLLLMAVMLKKPEKKPDLSLPLAELLEVKPDAKNKKDQ